MEPSKKIEALFSHPDVASSEVNTEKKEPAVYKRLFSGDDKD